MTWRHNEEDKIISTTAVRTSNLLFKITFSQKQVQNMRYIATKTNLLGQSYNRTAALSEIEYFNF